MSGKADCGCKKGVRGVGSAIDYWRGATLDQMAQWNPILAVAFLWNTPFAPWNLNMRGTFVDPTVLNLPEITIEDGKTRFSQPVIVDRIAMNVRAPNSFPGSIYKAEHDFYYARQSGIEAKVWVEGGPGYAISPYFTPIEAVGDLLAEGWPQGWVITNTQTVSGQLQATVPLESTPTTVIFTFRMWQPVGTTAFINMSTGDAYKILLDAGADAQTIDRLRNAPVGR